MATTTPAQGLPIPEETDDPAIVEDITNLALAIEKRLFAVYSNLAARDAAVPTPQAGQAAYLLDSKKLTIYSGSAWETYPKAVPTFTTGTAVPSNNTGVNGDVYFRI